TPRFACGTAFALPAKNVPPAHFPNAETFSGSSPVIKKTARAKVRTVFLVRVTGLDRLLRYARILSARVTPRFACGTALALPAKNDSLNRFLNAETFSGSSPVIKKQPVQKYELFFWCG